MKPSWTPPLDLPSLPPAAVLYTGDSADRALLADFAGSLTARGWRVGGIVQESFVDDSGLPRGRDLVEIDGGRRIALSRPTDRQLAGGECAMEDSALAEATGALRRAIAGRADLLVVEKFGKREQEHGGLLDETLAAMAEGLPVLTAVSAEAVEKWRTVTGGMSVLLPWDARALWRWWGPHRLYRDLELGIDPEATASRVVVGRNWVVVEGPAGCGLAHAPDGGTGRPIRTAGSLTGRRLRDLAALVHSWDPLEIALGVAAINAHHNRYDLEGPEDDGLAVLAEADGPLTVVGRFPGLAGRFDRPRIIAADPDEGELPPAAAGWMLPGGPAVLSSAALCDRSLPDILSSCRGETLLVGPSTPLTDRLLDYGPDALAGVVVTDAEGVARAAAEGGPFRALAPHVRHLLVRRP